MIDLRQRIEILEGDFRLFLERWKMLQARLEQEFLRTDRYRERLVNLEARVEKLEGYKRALKQLGRLSAQHLEATQVQNRRPVHTCREEPDGDPATCPACLVEVTES